MDECFILYWTNEVGAAQAIAYSTHEEAFGQWRAYGGAIEHKRGLTAAAYNARHDRLLRSASGHG